MNKAARQKLKNEATNISTSSLDQSDSDDLIVSSSDEKGQSPTKAHLPMAIKSTGRSHLSSSETSDHSDSFDPQQKLKFLQTSVKTSALSILNLITKATEKKNLYGFWSGLVPDPGVNLNPKLPFSYDFLTALMKESSFKLRSAMLHALSAWISACRQFLLLAENRLDRFDLFLQISIDSSIVISVKRL